VGMMTGDPRHPEERLGAGSQVHCRPMLLSGYGYGGNVFHLDGSRHFKEAPYAPRLRAPTFGYSRITCLCRMYIRRRSCNAAVSTHLKPPQNAGIHSTRNYYLHINKVSAEIGLERGEHPYHYSRNGPKGLFYCPNPGCRITCGMTSMNNLYPPGRVGGDGSSGILDVKNKWWLPAAVGRRMERGCDMRFSVKIAF
jgi:hypothetical protein